MSLLRICQLLLLLLLRIGVVESFVVPVARPEKRSTGPLFSLKPAAIPLMDSGKALARSGELLIDLTTALDLYGGALSAAGAEIRNAGDSIAQAAASCRFKTGQELVVDEMREAATCLLQAKDKFQQAVREAQQDELQAIVQGIAPMVETIESSGILLESAGAAIMRAEKVEKIGQTLVSAGAQISATSVLLKELSPDNVEAANAADRMDAAGLKMIEAGNQLQGIKPQASGKSWLKGGAM